MRIVESYGRGLLRAIRSQFSGPVEAVCELVDNALDHSLGQRIRIEVELSPDGFGITNVGGQGMGVEELAGYVAWGGSNAYDEGDRGHYGQGGKAALLYLGRGFRLLCRKAGEEDAWLLEDQDVLGGLGGPRDYGVLQPLPREQVPEVLRTTEREAGFVRIQSVGFCNDLSITASELARELAAVYAPTLRSGAATIRVNGEELRAPEIVLDPEVERVQIDVLVDGIHAVGWAGKVEKGANRAHQVRPGFTLVWRGRRVKAGVWFGSNPYAKGALASFYGELALSGAITPNLNKTGFLETGEVVWDRLSDLVLAQAAPVLDALRSPGGLATVNARDLRLARSVRAELEEVLRAMGCTERDACDEEVRVVITHRAGPERSEIVVSGGRRGHGIPRPDANGDRRGKERRDAPVPSIPEIVVDSWDAPVRSEVRELPSGAVLIAINKAHPAYASANAKYAIAEGVVTEVFRRGASDVDAFLTSADEALAAWGQRQIGSEGEEDAV